MQVIWFKRLKPLAPDPRVGLVGHHPAPVGGGGGGGADAQTTQMNEIKIQDELLGSGLQT